MIWFYIPESPHLHPCFYYLRVGWLAMSLSDRNGVSDEILTDQVRISTKIN